MIRRLKEKDAINFYDFILRCKDKYEDFYITCDKQRIFINSLNVIKKLLKYKEVYAVENNGIKGIILIFRQKEFRPYIKILVEKMDYSYDLIKFLFWNFEKQELFIKVKRENPICKILQKRFNFIGSRGKEVLYMKPKKLQEQSNGRNSIKT